jgi:hypothetical protein
MVIHDRVSDTKGVGKWDFGTTRYIPVSGGSRSRLPVNDDKTIPRYFGLVGIGEKMTEEIFTLPALYSFLGGAPVVRQGHGSIFVSLILEEHLKRMKEEGEDKEKKK